MVVFGSGPGVRTSSFPAPRFTFRLVSDSVGGLLSKERSVMAKAARQIKSIAFVSLGCPKNLVDSERMLGLLAADGLTVTSDPASADAIVINTCGFLEASKTESLQAIREAIAQKKTGRCQRVVVAGCLVQRHKTKLLAEVPEVDRLVGVFDREHIVQAVRGKTNPRQDHGHFLGKYHDLSRELAAAADLGLDLGRGGPSVAPPGGSDSAYGSSKLQTLNSSLTPPRETKDQSSSRLRRRSRSLETDPQALRLFAGQRRMQPGLCVLHDPFHSRHDALQADRRDPDGGARAVGRTEPSSSISSARIRPATAGTLDTPPAFPGMLRTLDRELKDVHWLRLMYAYPSCFSDDMIRAIAESDRIVKYIDMPLQHINDAMLTSMRRRVSRRQIDTLLKKLRDWVPGIAIRTTFIAGAPGRNRSPASGAGEICAGIWVRHDGRLSLTARSRARRWDGWTDKSPKS